MWNILDVLNVLQALVDKSGIVAELERDGGAELAACDGYLPGQSNVLRMLGYFSLPGLLRVRTEGTYGCHCCHTTVPASAFPSQARWLPVQLLSRMLYWLYSNDNRVTATAAAGAQPDR